MTAQAALPAGARFDPRLLALWVTASVASVAVFVLAASLNPVLYGVPVVAALGLGLVQGGAIVGALLWPRVAAAAAVVALVGFTVASPASGAAPWPVAVTSMVGFSFAVGLVAARGLWRPALLAWGSGVVASAVIGLVGAAATGADGAITADLVVFASVSAGVVGVALLLARWQDVRRQLTREREISASELARREVAEERTRIARELHDIVAHGMSAIQVQASSAKYRIPSLPPEAAEEFDALAGTARTAMGEMRRLLGVLRSEDAGAETAPQPGLPDVRGLVGDAARTGRVELVDETGTVDDVDAMTSLAAYRIVQESLSNVARHATGAQTVVRLGRLDGSLLIEVRNAAAPGRPASPPAPDGGGHGIRGMRERAELLGGTVTTGAQEEGGFLVRAVLPVADGRPAT